jgi:hypothetical protein
MKHATAETLEAFPELLAQLRSLKQLVERTPGSFYFKSKGFLHFHDDAAGIFADVKLDFVTFTRMRCTTKKEQSAVLTQVRRCLASA